MIDTTIPLWGLLLGLGSSVAWAVKVWLDFNKLKDAVAANKTDYENKIKHIEEENKELKKELREIRDILIKVEHNTGLLMLGRIKTNTKTLE